MTTRLPHALRARVAVGLFGVLLFAVNGGCRADDPTQRHAAAPTNQARPVEPEPSPAPDPAEVQRLNLESFDTVWTTIRDRHYDPTLGGADWDAAREKYRPLVDQAKSADEARGHMQAMIDTLGQSHMSLIPSGAYDALSGDDDDEGDESADDDREGQPGLRVRLVDVKNRVVLVTDVKPGGGADQVGVKPGWQLVRVGDSDVAELVGRIAESLATRGHGKPEMYASFGLENRLHGTVGETTTATFLNENGHEETVDIPLMSAPGEIAKLGALPPMRVDFEARRVMQGGVELGYISFNAFLDPPRLMSQFRAAIIEFARTEDPVDGVVIDVRGNVGGIVMMVPGMAGFFIDEAGTNLGTVKLREAELKLAVNPRFEQFDGPVAVLADACSVSAAELLAGGLRDAGVARVFGTATAGEALPAMVMRLANGDGFLFVFADYQTSNNQRLEGDGVLPDEAVAYDRESLLAGDDPMLAAAARWVSRQADGAITRPTTPPTTGPATRSDDR